MKHTCIEKAKSALVVDEQQALSRGAESGPHLWGDAHTCAEPKPKLIVTPVFGTSCQIGYNRRAGCDLTNCSFENDRRLVWRQPSSNPN